MPPPVSVVMAVRNGAAELPKAIESILAQTFTDFELIVVNDGSTDGTAAYLDAIPDRRVRVVHQEGPALAAAINRGIALARGRYIARHDHDDISRPARFAKQVSFLDENPDFALVGTHADIWIGNQPTERAHDHPSDDAALRFELLFHNPFTQSSVMIRKAAIDAIGGYSTDPKRQPPEDYELWSRLARRHRIANIPERLTIYREMPGSVSRVAVSSIRDKAAAISAENLAAALGESAPNQAHRDVTSLLHAAYGAVSAGADLAEMCRMIEEAGARITANAPGSDVSRRAAMKTATLRHHYRRWRLQSLLGPASPVAFAIWRYFGLKRLRQQSGAETPVD
jgi:glycosyltransferase involved in cell wall biosynthesis